MAKSARGRRRLLSRQFRPAPYPAPLHHRWEIPERDSIPKGALEKDWEHTTCPVCMESPHHAVLLLCSSHDKGCRPYMCKTSYRHSNCLDQFKKAYTKTMAEGLPFSVPGWPMCPLCRGQVKGCTVVEAAREHLDGKRRSCMQDGCSFDGTYRELRRHVKSEHPSARPPREVDPQLEQKWQTLERERERQDVITTVRSSMPGSVVLGDYVIDMDSDNSDDDEGGDLEGGSGGGPGVSSSILYFFLREGARLIRDQRENGASVGRDDDNDDDAGDYVPLYSSEGDDGDGDDDGDGVGPVNSQRIGGDVQSSERRRRQRRRQGD